MVGENVNLSQNLLENYELEANMEYSKVGNTSSSKTFFNGLNALSGVGIVSVPYALASGGWLTLLLIFLVAIASFYTGLLIKRCMEADHTIRAYPDIGERAFGKLGRTIVSIFMCTELYLVLTGFLLMEGDNLHNLFPQISLESCGLKLDGRASFIMLVALIMLPSVYLDDLSVLSYFSTTGIVASIVILGSILWVGAFEGVGFHSKGELINWSGIPTAVSLYGFCYCAHPVLPAIYNSMQKSDDFSRILLLCFLCSTIGYASVAISGYLMFGSKVNSQVTLNLPTDKLASKIAIYTTLINPLSKYALMLQPVIAATEGWFPIYQKTKCFKVLIRTCLVASQVIVALSVPFFGSLMSLIGAFLSVTASITLPCCCYWKISEDFITKKEKLLVLGTIALSIMITIFGTYTSLVQIIQGIDVALYVVIV